MACSTAFYYFYHLLEQALFIQLTLASISTLAVVSKELKNWRGQAVKIYSSAWQQVRQCVLVDPTDFSAWTTQHGLSQPENFLTRAPLKDDTMAMAMTIPKPIPTDPLPVTMQAKPSLKSFQPSRVKTAKNKGHASSKFLVPIGFISDGEVFNKFKKNKTKPVCKVFKNSLLHNSSEIDDIFGKI